MSLSIVCPSLSVICPCFICTRSLFKLYCSHWQFPLDRLYCSVFCVCGIYPDLVPSFSKSPWRAMFVSYGGPYCAQVATHEHLLAILPKHYPPPSLLMLVLSKQWRTLHVILSTPVLAGASYLHIFKSSSPDEQELECLEINECSIVFINDEDVGG